MPAPPPLKSQSSQDRFSTLSVTVKNEFTELKSIGLAFLKSKSILKFGTLFCSLVDHVYAMSHRNS